MRQELAVKDKTIEKPVISNEKPMGTADIVQKADHIDSNKLAEEAKSATPAGVPTRSMRPSKTSPPSTPVNKGLLDFLLLYGLIHYSAFSAAMAM